MTITRVSVVIAVIAIVSLLLAFVLYAWISSPTV